MNPSIRAFRFIVSGVPYAVDIQGDALYLLTQGPSGWAQSDEMAAITATNQAIEAAGGHVKFVWSILESINRALRIIQGKPRPEDLPEVEASPQGDVLAYLNSSVVAHTMMDGVVQLRVR